MKLPAFVMETSTKVTQTAASTGAKIATKVGPKAPELLLAGGVVLILTGTVTACVATVKAKEKFEEGVEKAERIKEDSPEPLNGTDTVDVMVRRSYLKTGLDIAQSYIIPAALITSGVFCIVISHNMEHKRMLAAVATLDAVNLKFEEYRRNVVQDQGPSADIRYLTGDVSAKADFYEEQEDGKVKKVKKNVKVRKNSADLFAKLFDDCNSTEWKKEKWRNREFFDNQSVFHKRKLICEGRVLWWDVMKDFGFAFDPVYTQYNWVLTGSYSDDEPMYEIVERFSENEIAAAAEARRNPEPSFWIEFRNLIPVWDEYSEA